MKSNQILLILSLIFIYLKRKIILIFSKNSLIFANKGDRSINDNNVQTPSFNFGYNKLKDSGSNPIVISTNQVTEHIYNNDANALVKYFTELGLVNNSSTNEFKLSQDDLRRNK